MTCVFFSIPLNKQNTEEYKQQEARASKIAQEIESGFHHKNRAALENGDEEERFSAVMRPENNNNFRYGLFIVFFINFMCFRIRFP